MPKKKPVFTIMGVCLRCGKPVKSKRLGGDVMCRACITEPAFGEGPEFQEPNGLDQSSDEYEGPSESAI